MARDRLNAAFRYDPYFYHVRHAFDSIKYETEKAYLLEVDGNDFWVPKRLCKGLNRDQGYVYIHLTFIKRFSNRRIDNPFGDCDEREREDEREGPARVAR